jgi:hypothetical protein
MLALVTSSVSYAPMAPIGRTTTVQMQMEGLSTSIGAAIEAGQEPWTGDSDISTLAGMQELAKKQNPIVGFWDPLNIVDSADPTTIGWFRHAEIKHGRVAMAAFVGFLVQSNGIHFPWGLTGLSEPDKAISFAQISAAGGPADQWDALPTESKIQILCAVGFLEVIGELSPVLKANGQKHYCRGGKPGYYPPFKGFFNDQYWPHPLPLNLWDPFGLTKKMTPERKEKALLAEVNNGRLAMIGIFGLCSASKGLIVPGLDSLGLAPYSGEYMAPFTAADGSLPFVDSMAGVIGTLY